MDFKNNIKNLQLKNDPTVELLNINPLRFVEDQNKKQQLLFNQIAKEKAMDRENHYRQTELLEEIRDSSVKITDLMQVLSINSNQQSEIMEVIADILLLSNSKTEEEATNKFNKTKDKLKQFKDDVELIQFLNKAITTGFSFAIMKIKGEI